MHFCPPDFETRRESFPILPPRLKRGSHLGRFRIDGEVTIGGEAGIFRAIDSATDEVVALKVLSPYLATFPAKLASFLRESRLAARVQHRALLPVLAVGRQGDYCYYALPFASGDLASVARAPSYRRQRHFYRAAAARFADVAAALATLHANGIAHRDVKPSNILLDGDGSWFLSDFGSAMATDDRAEEPAFRSGTVYYMAPEQLLGSAPPEDARGDVYALGTAMYETVCGHEPFPRLSPKELALWKLKRYPARPRDTDERLPLRWDTILRRAMEPNPKLRYESCTELAYDLEMLATSQFAAGGRVSFTR